MKNEITCCQPKLLLSERVRNHKNVVQFSNRLKHRHQRCKAPSLCKTFFITNTCRLKEAGQKKYLSYNFFLTRSFSQRLSNNVFLTTSFSLRLLHNIFLTTSFSQRISHSVFLTPLPLHNHPNNVVLTTSQYTRNLSVLYKYLKFD